MINYILVSVAIWMGAWFFVILLNVIFGFYIEMEAKKINDASTETVMREVTSVYREEIVKDGDSMFKTGLFFVIAHIACDMIQYDIVQFIIIAFCGFSCIPPTVSALLTMVPQAIKMKFMGTTMISISAVSTSLAQISIVIVMAISVLR